MVYVLNHKVDGVFVGTCLGLAFFAKLEDAGQTEAPSVATMEEADAWRQELGELLLGDVDALEVVEVTSAHWLDLRSAGLNTGNMSNNELED